MTITRHDTRRSHDQNECSSVVMYTSSVHLDRTKKKRPHRRTIKIYFKKQQFTKNKPINVGPNRRVGTNGVFIIKYASNNFWGNLSDPRIPSVFAPINYKWLGKKKKKIQGRIRHLCPLTIQYASGWSKLEKNMELSWKISTFCFAYTSGNDLFFPLTINVRHRR